MILMFFEELNPIFGGKMGVKGSGASRPDQKVGSPGKSLDSTVISKIVFKNLGPEPPLPY